VLGYKDIRDTNVGSSTLAHTITNRLSKLSHHFFGHIHEGYGIHQQELYVAYNASMLDHYTRELNKPHIFVINS
jgi:Icc-related predicted phosphoesterase